MRPSQRPMAPSSLPWRGWRRRGRRRRARHRCGRDRSASKRSLARTMAVPSIGCVDAEDARVELVVIEQAGVDGDRGTVRLQRLGLDHRNRAGASGDDEPPAVHGVAEPGDVRSRYPALGDKSCCRVPSRENVTTATSTAWPSMAPPPGSVNDSGSPHAEEVTRACRAVRSVASSGTSARTAWRAGLISCRSRRSISSPS